jgi:transcriptional regulator with XRE-family HTH domain
VSITGDSIREMRQERRLSMKQLGARVGISAAYICDIENGKRMPPKRTVNAIADALHCLTEVGAADCRRCGGSGKEPLLTLRAKKP